MRIKLMSIMVDDQEKALRFYTDVLGFKKKHDIPVGEYRWITVTSPEGPEDVSGGDVFAGHSARRLRGDRHRGRVRPIDDEGRGVHTATGTGRTCDARRLRGHLREPDSVVPTGVASTWAEESSLVVRQAQPHGEPINHTASQSMTRGANR